MSVQLPLKLAFPEELRFEDYFSDQRDEVQQYLVSLTGSSNTSIFLWGEEGTGKSHLCQAYFHHLNESEIPVAFIDLSEDGMSPEVLEGLENFHVVIIDTFESVINDSKWHEAIFHLYNRLNAAGHHLVVTSDQHPEQVDNLLADLRSRLLAGLVFKTEPMTDEQKIQALKARAASQGLVLSNEVLNYLMTRLPRDTLELFATLKKLDEASMQHKRRVTVPFVKEILLL
jgi:DnaA family protein